jgi:dTDP-4-dehydrorhamnose 3,5-epimerase
MIFQETALHGAYLISLEPFQDERGLFARTFCKREFAAIGHQKEFVQFNHSHNKHQATLRGMHFQHPPHTEIKLIRCIRGGVYDVIVDLRPDSPTFLQHLGVELSAQNMQMIYIPEGFAHGFQTLEDHCELVYHHTAYYTPGQEGGIRYDDPRLGINWPFPPRVISEKDQHYPLLREDFIGIQV